MTMNDNIVLIEGLTKLVDGANSRIAYLKQPTAPRKTRSRITEMTKRLGKKRFEELLNGLLIRPEGKPVLGPAIGYRPGTEQCKK